MTDYTWADLDEANKADGHYHRRRYPARLIRAMRCLEAAERQHDELIDQYCSGQDIDIVDVVRAERLVTVWDEYCSAIRGGGELPDLRDLYRQHGLLTQPERDERNELRLWNVP